MSVQDHRNAQPDQAKGLMTEPVLLQYFTRIFIFDPNLCRQRRDMSAKMSWQECNNLELAF